MSTKPESPRYVIHCTECGELRRVYHRETADEVRDLERKAILRSDQDSKLHVIIVEDLALTRPELIA